MFKKTISLLLALLLTIALAAAAFAARSDTEEEPSAEPIAEPAAPVIYFDTSDSGWKEFVYVGFHIWEVDGEAFLDWGGKKQRGADEGDGVWSYDLASHGITLDPEKQYAVVFYSDKGAQTYNLLFDTTCYGDTAYPDPSQITENPEDSNKTAMPAYWRHQDPTVNGPELKISSIGNVIGSCCPRSKTPAGLLAEFLGNTYTNAALYSGLTGQQIIDNVGVGLGLTAEEVDEVVLNSGVDTDWNYDDSILPKDLPGNPLIHPEVIEGEGTVEIKNLATDPEGDPAVRLTAVAMEGWRFRSWELEPFEDAGYTLVEGDLSASSIVISYSGEITAYARFAADITPTGIRGDADGDGKVTVLDATRIQRYLAKMVGEGELDMTAADADGDGKVTVLDATRIQRVLAKLCDMDGNTPPVPGQDQLIVIGGDGYELPVIK